jgi:hypothetical protein
MQDNIELKKFEQYMGGLHWVYENKDTKEKLSIICHTGSYGFDKGTFEIMAPWLKYDVEGHLTFQEVHKAILKLSKRKK